MADFLGLMKQAAQLQSKMQAMQAELDQIEVEDKAAFPGQRGRTAGAREPSASARDRGW